MQKSVLFFFLIFLSSFCLAQKHSHKFYSVLKVIDGDTFRVSDGSPKGMKIRLIGVDAPESRNTGRKVMTEFGKRSTIYLSNMIMGKRVRLEYDVRQKDQYGRTLAYVYLEDGTFVNAELVKNGYAVVMTVPPDVKYQDLFLKLERNARKRNKGLWHEGESKATVNK